MNQYFVEKFEQSETIPEIFEIIKEIVWKSLNKSRAGLSLGMVEMGTAPQGMIGAYFVLGSNMIVINETVINRIKETDKNILRPYVFSVLLHEYLHSIGITSDEEVRMITYGLVLDAFGEDSVVTEISKDMGKFFPNLIYPDDMPPGLERKIKLVRDFDSSDTSYIG